MIDVLCNRCVYYYAIYGAYMRYMMYIAPVVRVPPGSTIVGGPAGASIQNNMLVLDIYGLEHADPGDPPHTYSVTIRIATGSTTDTLEIQCTLLGASLDWMTPLMDFPRDASVTDLGVACNSPAQGDLLSYDGSLDIYDPDFRRVATLTAAPSRPYNRLLSTSAAVPGAGLLTIRALRDIDSSFPAVRSWMPISVVRVPGALAPGGIGEQRKISRARNGLTGMRFYGIEDALGARTYTRNVKWTSDTPGHWKGEWYSSGAYPELIGYIDMYNQLSSGWRCIHHWVTQDGSWTSMEQTFQALSDSDLWPTVKDFAVHSDDWVFYNHSYYLYCGKTEVDDGSGDGLNQVKIYVNVSNENRLYRKRNKWFVSLYATNPVTVIREAPLLAIYSPPGIPTISPAATGSSNQASDGTVFTSAAQPRARILTANTILGHHSTPCAHLAFCGDRVGGEISKKAHHVVEIEGAYGGSYSGYFWRNDFVSRSYPGDPGTPVYSSSYSLSSSPGSGRKRSYRLYPVYAGPDYILFFNILEGAAAELPTNGMTALSCEQNKTVDYGIINSVSVYTNPTYRSNQEGWSVVYGIMTTAAAGEGDPSECFLGLSIADYIGGYVEKVSPVIAGNSSSLAGSLAQVGETVEAIGPVGLSVVGCCWAPEGIPGVPQPTGPSGSWIIGAVISPNTSLPDLQGGGSSTLTLSTVSVTEDGETVLKAVLTFNGEVKETVPVATATREWFVNKCKVYNSIVLYLSDIGGGVEYTQTVTCQIPPEALMPTGDGAVPEAVPEWVAPYPCDEHSASISYTDASEGTKFRVLFQQQDDEET